MLTPGQILSLSVEKPAAGGWMIARLDGQVILVNGAIPGERVTARVARVGKHVAFADTISADEPSIDRRPPIVDPQCGGCLYAHMAYARQLEVKALVITDAFARIGHVTLPSPVSVAASPEAGYRMRARLHVRRRAIGFFREGTHELCDARLTHQLLPATSDVLDRLAETLRSRRIDTVREVEISENCDATERVVSLDSVIPSDIVSLPTTGLSGLMIREHAVWGEAHVTDGINIGEGGHGEPMRLRRHALAFSQGNRYLLQQLVRHVIERLPRDAVVVDLYAGGGLFSIAAATCRGARVTAVEGDRFAAADLTANATASGAPVAAVHAAVEMFLSRQPKHADVIIVDPSRTGMSREALDGVLRLRPRQIVYVSCDVATLARDARKIIDGGYTIDRADAFDLFPNTPHVECVVDLRI